MKTQIKWLAGLGLIALILGVSSPGYSQVTGSTSKEGILHKMAGDRYLKDGAAVAAVSEYQQAVTLNPRSTATLFNLAIAYYSVRNIEGATLTLEKILAIDPSDAEAQYNLACLLLYQGNLEGAKLHFKKPSHVATAHHSSAHLPRKVSSTSMNLKPSIHHPETLLFFFFSSSKA